MPSTSYTQPPQLPPPTACSAAHRRVSSGTRGSGTSASLSGRRSTAPMSGSSDVDPSGVVRGVDVDLDEVAVAEPADRTAGPRLGADVPDARTRGHAGEPTVGDERNPPGGVDGLERGGDLVGLGHPDAGSDADEHHHLAGLDRVALDRVDGIVLGGEHAGGAAVVVDARSSSRCGAMAVLLTMAPPGARFRSGTSRCWADADRAGG